MCGATESSRQRQSAAREQVAAEGVGAFAMGAADPTRQCVRRLLGCSQKRPPPVPPRRLGTGLRGVGLSRRHLRGRPDAHARAARALDVYFQTLTRLRCVFLFSNVGVKGGVGCGSTTTPPRSPTAHTKKEPPALGHSHNVFFSKNPSGPLKIRKFSQGARRARAPTALVSPVARASGLRCVFSDPGCARCVFASPPRSQMCDYGVWASGVRVRRDA